MKISLIYSTFPNKESADVVAREIIAENAAACVNIIANVFSSYRWNDDIVEDQEVIMLAKTTAHKVNDVRNTIERLHPYSCPAIIEISADAINEGYAKWMVENTVTK